MTKDFFRQLYKEVFTLGGQQIRGRHGAREHSEPGNSNYIVVASVLLGICLNPIVYVFNSSIIY